MPNKYFALSTVIIAMNCDIHCSSTEHIVEQQAEE